MKDIPGYMQVAVDAVVFTIMSDDLKLLLIKRRDPPFQGKFALPGGFVEQSEELEDAVSRELEEETGVKNISLHQLTAKGTVDRDPRGRVLSIPFLALIQPDQRLKAATDATEAKWFSVYDLPELGFDHKEIIAEALQHMRFEVQTTNIAFQMLPNRFTLSQLQHLYELILDKPLDKRNFRKKIKELDILKETSEYFLEGAHRPAKLYIFRDRSYKPLSEKMQVFL